MMLGGMTVEEMLDRMTCLELDEWCERMLEEPLGGRRDDVRTAKLGSIVAGLLSKDGARKAWEILLDYGGHKEARKPEDLQLYFERLTLRMGGKIVKPKAN